MPNATVHFMVTKLLGITKEKGAVTLFEAQQGPREGAEARLCVLSPGEARQRKRKETMETLQRH